jgi:magnesium-transporting ATPase (P-type)
MSQIEIKVNYILAFILLLQIVLCIIVAILDSVFIRKYKDTDKYIAWSSYTAAGDAALIFCTYFVLINTMIPISLIVSLEIVKMAQSIFINKDKFMHSKLMEKGAWVRSASLNEELGQIEHIFTDKTGTLTTNRMEFKIAVIGNQIYGDIGLVRPNPNKPPQKEVGFKDDELARLMKSRGEEGNSPVRGITIKNKEKNNTISLSNMRELAH